MTQHTPGAAAAPETALETYRALRVGLVGATLLLLVAVAVEIVRVDAIPVSISAAFYSPVRGVLVGALVAVGLTLIVIRGRPGWENGLLDVAGVLVPIVALVPTPVALATVPGGADLAVTCPRPDVACVPAELTPDVENNVIAYLLVGLAALVFVWVRLLRARARVAARAGVGARAPARGGGDAGVPRTRGTVVVVASGLWVATTAWFVLGRHSFIENAHYASAVAFFAILVAVVWINARHTSPPVRPRRMARRGYRRSYLAIASTMAVSVVAGLVVWLAVPEDSTFPLVFWIEVVLLVLTMTFWVLQTVEHWDHTEPVPSAPIVI